MDNDLHVPSGVSEAADLATQLFEQLNSRDTQQDTETPQEEDETVNEAPQETAPVDDTTEQRYRTLQGKYNKEVVAKDAENRQLRKELETYRAQTPKEEPLADTRLEEVLGKLKEEYPDELIENLRLLHRLEAEQITREAMQPIVASHATQEEIKQQTKVEGFVSNITQAAPIWENIWGVVIEIANGEEPSDPGIAAFLNSPDPSGLYTNLELLDMYNEKFDSDRFARVCNLYTQPAAPKPNPSRDALLAPSRSNSQPVPQGVEQKVWTMPEIEQFQRDKRSEKYSEEQADAIWLDIQKALAENRIR